MRKLLAWAVAALFLSIANVAAAANCANNPYTLTNGQGADATQVMANFNNLLTCLNVNMLPNVAPNWTGTGQGVGLNLSGALSVTGAITASGGVVGNLTGNVTGGVSGNAGTATRWLSGQTETLTGDVTGSVGGITGAGGWTVPTTLIPTGITAAQYGNTSGTAYPVCNFDAKGRATNCVTQGINFANPGGSNWYSITNAGGATYYFEWGQYDSGCDTCWTGSQVSVTFPHQLPNNMVFVSVTPWNSQFSTGQKSITFVGTPNNTNAAFTGSFSGNNIRGFFWYIVGF